MEKLDAGERPLERPVERPEEGSPERLASREGSLSAESAIENLAARARKASLYLASRDSGTKNRALRMMADSLAAAFEDIAKANHLDLCEAQSAGLPAAFVKRLTISPAKVHTMAEGIRNVASLPDPVGRVIETRERPNGLVIRKVTIPFGVVGMIYESRPDVTSDAASLCLKSGNAVILKGGSESQRTNLAIVSALHKGLEGAGAPRDSVQYLDGNGRAGVQAMLRARGLIDLVIPRGGAGLIRAVVEQSSVPVIETGTGNCHIYVHKDADQHMAASIILNAKCQNPAVCNAVETLLVDRSIAGEFLPEVCRKLAEAGVELKGCSEVRAIVPGVPAASEADWDMEYLNLTLAVRVVDDLEAAIANISEHGTGHSEAIITRDKSAARRFQTEVDAACVYVNSSTRFTDGSEFGFGAEIGISTQKLHARGPLGLSELTTYKYLVTGTGQIR